METLFIKQELHRQLVKDGLVVLPFLNADELITIQNLYFTYHPNGIPPQMRDGIHMTCWCSDKDYKVKIQHQIESIITPAANRLLSDYRCVNPVFIVKRKGEDTIFPIHQDWSIVDELNHQALNIWIPLQDVDESNGALWVVRGSHNLGNYVRGPGILFPDFTGIQEHIKDLIEPIRLKAGEAVIFYHRVIHGSPPNLQQNPRVAVAVSILPKEVPLQIYFQKDATSYLETYETDDDFLIEYTNVRDETARIPPKGRRIAVKPGMSAQVITPSEFDYLYFGKSNLVESKKKGIWHKIKYLFKS